MLTIQKMVMVWKFEVIPDKLGAGVVQSVQTLGYGLDDESSIPGTGRELFSVPPRPDRL
jgi:hypothetical protein